MKKPIMTQLRMLLDNMPRVVTDVNIEFRVDPKAFAVALLTACGQLKKNGDDKVLCFYYSDATRGLNSFNGVAFNGNPSQSYVSSPAVWVHTVLPAILRTGEIGRMHVAITLARQAQRELG